MTDAQPSVLDRARAGDPEAIALLWREHRGWVAAVLAAHAPRAADVEDLLQDVVVSLVKHVATLRSDDALRPWLRTVAIHAAAGAGRRHATRKRTAALDAVEPVADARGGARRAGAVELEAVLARLQSLPAEWREALLLQAVDGLSQREIAATLGIGEAAVESRIARARRALREQRAKDDAVAYVPLTRHK